MRAGRGHRALATGLALVLWAAAAPAQHAASVPEPEGYRTEAYRAPVPATLAGARVLTTEEAHALWEEGAAAFVDVLPRPAAPRRAARGRDSGAPRPRDDIPGSVWLPETGYGALSPEAAAYLEEGLRRASGGDPAAPLVFYCLAECWMSWNAAKRGARGAGLRGRRLVSRGHRRLGRPAGLPLERREPEPGAPER